jgi:hypothetical protein
VDPNPVWTTESPVGNSTSGGGKNIDVLDTALNPANAPLCLTLPGTGSQMPSKVNNPPCNFLTLPEGTFSLPDELIPEGYPSFDPNGTYNPCYTNPMQSACSFVRHGEFVAKLIQHIAPDARLSLIGVLNNYGAADVRSLIYGLYQVAQATRQPPAQTIINLSLSIEPPTECLPAIWKGSPEVSQTSTLNFPSHSPLHGPSTVVTTWPGNINCFTAARTTTIGSIAGDPSIARLYVPIGLVMEQMFEDHYTLVAAAGNDSSSGQQFGADMPAAFCGVYAVGATTASDGPPSVSGPGTGNSQASFSDYPYLDNQSCIRVPISFSSLTPGPDVIAHPVSSIQSSWSAYAPGTSVCSFYDDPTYTDDMGLWNGTSFAAPLVSGALAAFGTLSNVSPSPQYASFWGACH